MKEGRKKWISKNQLNQGPRNERRKAKEGRKGGMKGGPGTRLFFIPPCHAKIFAPPSLPPHRLTVIYEHGELAEAAL
jgi:hypothetical protein